MKSKIVGCRVTAEVYDQICEMGVPSDILREGLELYLISTKNPRKRTVNALCFDCRYKSLCVIIDRYLAGKNVKRELEQ